MDLALIERLGLRADVQRTHVGFMGRHAALNGLRVARAFAEADADAVVLICRGTLQPASPVRRDPEQVVANAWLADGAAAVVASAQRPISFPVGAETNDPPIQDPLA